MLVEHDSRVMQRSYEELRAHFQTLFIRANPGVRDMLDACDKAFFKADADHGGTLSHKEFAGLIKRITGEAASSKMLKKLLRFDCRSQQSINEASDRQNHG